MTTLFTNANIIDGEQNQEIKKGYVVVDSETGYIIDVGQYDMELWSKKVSPEKTIDLKGAWLLPGLINGHVHLMRDGSADPDLLIKGESMEIITLNALKNAKSHLAIGVTSVRDLGSPGLTTLSLKRVIDAGLFEGPNIQSSGTPLIITGGHFRMGKEVDGVDEVRKGTRQLLKTGVDVVKLFTTGGIYSQNEEPGSPQFTKEEIAVAVEVAHMKNIPVAAHAQGLQGILNCLEAGVDTIEHAIYADDRAFELFLERDAFLVPTMVAMTRIAEGEKQGIPKYAVEKAKQVAEVHFKMLEKAVKNGIKIATGTDAGSPCNPPRDIYLEMEIMRAAGMSEMQVIQSSTSIAAKAIGLTNVGSVVKGNKADFLIVDSNPLKDLKGLESIKMVVKDGKIIDIDRL